MAVIDAMLALLQEGKVPPPAEMIAERAGVSVASVFRYFDGLADLQVQALSRFRERFEPLVVVEPAQRDQPLDARIEALVTARLDLYEQAGAIMLVGRLRSLEHEPLVAASASMRGVLADQVRALLGADGARLVPLVDALTSLESWDVMRRTHSRSRGQIAAAWSGAIATLIATDAASDRPARKERT